MFFWRESKFFLSLQTLLTKQQDLMLVERGLEEEKLVSALDTDLGFDKGRPVSALIIFRCTSNACCSGMALLLDLPYYYADCSLHGGIYWV